MSLSASSKTGNFTKRILAAIVLAPIGIWAVMTGGIGLILITGVAAIVCACEWALMVSHNLPKWKRICICAVLSSGALTGVLVGSYHGLSIVLAVSAAAGLIAWVIGVVFRNNPASLLFGAIYVSLPFGAFIYLREFSDNAQMMMIAIFVIVWGTDSAGYLAGKAYGGPLLSPKNSPGKTWTGAIGGVIYAALAGAAVSNLTQTSLILWLVWAIFLSIASQQGDLLESSFKRRFGIKDMSNIIPGHGGLLDRLDGLMAAVTVAALINMFLPQFVAGLMGE
ncbi:phosphatidate cytidylyltransferase [Hirschia litorea]|uniref:Phosphatidate cytidylyltransferase n=1 Tax=Hirschia litorea TaxID=1199156 RepID=A0ABW2IHB3_9PROT